MLTGAASLGAGNAFSQNAQSNAIQPVKPIPAFVSHAQSLHDVAERFSMINGRLANVLARVTGPVPPTAAASTDKSPTPDGVLYVAQFGAERLRIESDRLDELVCRLENLA